MFTTGSKFLIGSAILAAVAAVVYGVSQDGVMGTIGLASAAVALSILAGVTIFTRDSNVHVNDEAAVESCAAGAPVPGNSIWAFGFALSAVVIGVGLVTYQAVFTIGIVLLMVTGAEWVTQAWADRASAVASHNSEVRARIANPLEFPLGAAIGIGILVYAFSRIMLWFDATNTVIAFVVLGASVVIVAFLFAYRPRVGSRAAVGAVAFGAIALIAGGAAAGIDGERNMHPHETTEELAPEGICESPDEFEADENASQSVAATASVAAEITLDDSGQLTFEVPGPVEAGAPGLSLPRSNPNNVIFHNESGEHRRLSVDMGVVEIEVEGEDGEVEEVANQICTTLVDDGGSQNLTLKIDAPSSIDPDGFLFFVPGVESATLPLVVP